MSAELVTVVEESRGLPGFDVRAVVKEYGPTIKSRKLELMVAAYVGVAKGDATNAARVAGYGWPEKTGCRIRNKYRRIFELADEAIRERLVMGAREWDEIVTTEARTPSRDRFKYVELWGRVIGRVSDKLQVTVDRPTLNQQLTILVSSLLQTKAPGQIIDVTPESQQLVSDITTDPTLSAPKSAK